MKAHLTRRYLFSASHRLHSAAMSADENRRHLRQVQQSLRTRPQLRPGSDRQRTGRSGNRHGLQPRRPRPCVEREVLSRYDLENLNTMQEFAVTVPTTENLCIEIFEILQRGFPHAHLERVRLEETMMNSFEYAG